MHCHQEWRLYILCPTFHVSLLVSHSRSPGVTSHLNYSCVHMRMRKIVHTHTLARARTQTHGVNGVVWNTNGACEEVREKAP